MKKIKEYPGWKPAGQDGELILYASPNETQGVLVDRGTGQLRGEPQSLQVFFKWGNFVEVQE